MTKNLVDATGRKLQPLTRVIAGVGNRNEDPGYPHFVWTEYILRATSTEGWWKPPHLSPLESSKLTDISGSHYDHPKMCNPIPVTEMIRAHILYVNRPDDWYERCLADKQINRMMVKEDYDRKDPGEFGMDLENSFHRDKDEIYRKYGYRRGEIPDTEHLDWSALSDRVRAPNELPDPTDGSERNLMADNLTIKISFVPETGYLDYPHKLDLTGCICKVHFDSKRWNSGNQYLYHSRDVNKALKKLGWTYQDAVEKNHYNQGLSKVLYPPNRMATDKALEQLEYSIDRVTVKNEKGKHVYLGENQTTEDTLICNLMKGPYTDLDLSQSMREKGPIRSPTYTRQNQDKSEDSLGIG